MLLSITQAAYVDAMRLMASSYELLQDAAKKCAVDPAELQRIKDALAAMDSPKAVVIIIGKNIVRIDICFRRQKKRSIAAFNCSDNDTPLLLGYCSMHYF